MNGLSKTALLSLGRVSSMHSLLPVVCKNLSRPFSTKFTKGLLELDPTIRERYNANKHITNLDELDMTNHDGVKRFGEDQWKRLLVNASVNGNVATAGRPVMSAASGYTESLTDFNITPGVIHESFRNMKPLDDSERERRFSDLYYSAVNLILETPANPNVARWLALVALLVFGMVVLGGLTRLTKSGLSMVHWKFTGEKRPSTPEEWEAEFDRYKASPEYKLHNTGMSLEDFKFIYHMEYGHRTLGRVIGLVFALPFVYFIATKRVSLKTPMGKGLLACLGLGAVQGGIGWWMVKSGLNEEDNATKAKVSPYRLATHLVTAFALLTLLTVFHARAKHGTVRPFLGAQPLSPVRFMGTYSPTSLAHALAMMTFFTAASGALVAGNDAGLVYNEFPLMGGQMVPDDLLSPYVTPVWRNFTENPVAVQWVHRCMAVSTWTIALVTAGRCFFGVTLPAIRSAANRVFGLATLQASLGISTLLMGVPVELAACHQAGAMLVLMSAVRLMYLTKNPAVALDSNVTQQLELAQYEATVELKKIQQQRLDDAARARAEADAHEMGYSSFAEYAQAEYEKELAKQAALDVDADHSVTDSTADSDKSQESKDEKKTDVKGLTTALLVAMGVLPEDHDDEMDTQCI